MAENLQTQNEIDDIDIARVIECDCNDLSKHIQVKKNDLTIICQNIRSIYCNFDNFLLNLSTFKFETDVIILTECRLNKNKPIPQLNNYSSFKTTYQLNQNDGVVVYVKTNLNHKIKEVELNEASCLRLDILNNIVLCIYRSPSNKNADNFINSLSTYLEKNKTKKNIIIAGDININIKPSTNELPQDYKNRIKYTNTLSNFGILPGHTKSTREKTCLDHIMLNINEKKYIASIAILQTSTTDHYTIFLNLSKQKSKHVINKTFTKVDYENAVISLQNSNISELLYCNDPDKLIDDLTKKLTQAILKNSILLQIPRSKRIIKPWITTGVLRCIRNRNKLQKKNEKRSF